MNAWKYIIIVAIAATAFILLLSLLTNLVISWAAGRYSDKTLKKNLKELEEMLPGKNCGACGCKNCAEYAMAVFTYRKETNCCPEGEIDLPQRLDAYMEQFQESLVNDTPKNDNGWEPRNPNL